jgi:hypothetical protein
MAQVASVNLTELITRTTAQRGEDNKTRVEYRLAAFVCKIRSIQAARLGLSGKNHKPNLGYIRRRSTNEAAIRFVKQLKHGIVRGASVNRCLPHPQSMMWPGSNSDAAGHESQ